MDAEALSQTKTLIEKHEGRKNTAYVDTAGHPTIGIGFNLDRSDARQKIEALGLNFDDVRAGTTSLSDAQVDALFDGDVQKAVADAQALVSNFDDLSAARQAVVVDMVFNLGSAGFAKFHNTIAAIESGDWAGAAQQMLDSAWAKQVKGRATEDANLMTNG
ncbi:MAG TPA: glycoside hydrolase family protein [Thermoanaerobaculia bacterium]|nr:glycoside hydrolase family protein [Thermoanaerobaculia bacterium]